MILEGFLVDDKPYSEVLHPMDKLEPQFEESKSDASERKPTLPLAIPSYIPYYELPFVRKRYVSQSKATISLIVPY